MTHDIGYRVAAELAITVVLVFQTSSTTAEDQGRSHSRFGWARGIGLAIGLLVVLVITYVALQLAYFFNNSPGGFGGGALIAAEVYPDGVVVLEGGLLMAVVLVCGVVWIGRPAPRGLAGELLRVAQLTVALIGSIALAPVLAYGSVTGDDFVGPPPPWPSGATVVCVIWVAISLALAYAGLPESRRWLHPRVGQEVSE